MKHFLCLAAFGFLLSTAAHAEVVVGKIDHKSVPLPFLDLLVRGENNNKEDFISGAYLPIEKRGRSKVSIDQQDINVVVQARYEEERNKQVKKYKHYDSNSDGVVTKGEVSDGWQKRALKENMHPFQYSELRKLILSEFDVVDSDKNEELTAQEMNVVVDARDRQRTPIDDELDMLVKLLQLDPNKDGVLTMEELAVIAGDVFDLVDQDKSGILTKSEVSPLRTSRDAELFEEQFGEAEVLRRLVESQEKANPQ